MKKTYLIYFTSGVKVDISGINLTQEQAIQTAKTSLATRMLTIDKVEAL